MHRYRVSSIRASSHRASRLDGHMALPGKHPRLALIPAYRGTRRRRRRRRRVPHIGGRQPLRSSARALRGATRWRRFPVFRTTKNLVATPLYGVGTRLQRSPRCHPDCRPQPKATSLLSGATCGHHPAYLRPRDIASVGRFLPPAARKLVRAAYSIPSFHSASGRCRSSPAYFSHVNAGQASVVVVLRQSISMRVGRVSRAPPKPRALEPRTHARLRHTRDVPLSSPQGPCGRRTLAGQYSTLQHAHSAIVLTLSSVHCYYIQVMYIDKTARSRDEPRTGHATSAKTQLRARCSGSTDSVL